MEKLAGTVRDGNLPRSFITEKVSNHRNCFYENTIVESKHSSLLKKTEKSLFFHLCVSLYQYPRVLVEKQNLPFFPTKKPKGGGEKIEKTDIKSNKPHLTGGE